MENEKREMYRMTTAQRQAYVAQLLFPGGEQEALRFREECDAYWRAHPDEWEKVRIPEDQPIPLI